MLSEQEALIETIRIRLKNLVMKTSPIVDFHYVFKITPFEAKC